MSSSGRDIFLSKRKIGNVIWSRVLRISARDHFSGPLPLVKQRFLPDLIKREWSALAACKPAEALGHGCCQTALATETGMANLALLLQHSSAGPLPLLRLGESLSPVEVPGISLNWGLDIIERRDSTLIPLVSANRRALARWGFVLWSQLGNEPCVLTALDNLTP